jgi:hypothetical protein
MLTHLPNLAHISSNLGPEKWLHDFDFDFNSVAPATYAEKSMDQL